MSNVLIENIEKVHTTEMGVDRIRKNLRLDDIDVVEWCRTKILDKDSVITRQGKNKGLSAEFMMIVFWLSL